MPSPEFVSPVPLDDARDWLNTLAATFLDNPYDDKFDKWARRVQRTWQPERTWGHRDRGRYVATLATQQRVLTVPGPGTSTRDREVDALTGVTVAATHRRRGLLTAMLGASLDAARDRGDAVSVLVAAEWPIYGRFGYAAAVDAARFTYHPRRPNAALPVPPAGSIHRLEAAELGEIAPRVFDAARRLRPGHVDRHAPWWDRRLGLDGYEMLDEKKPTWYVHEGPDGPDGLLAWTPTRDFDLTQSGAVKVDEFAAATDAAYRDLWAYLGGLDLVDEIDLDGRPVDEPIRWVLRDGRALVQRELYDMLWLRLLDVPAALSARAYATPGRLVLEVVDEDYGAFAAGRYLLEADEADAKCTPTTEPAQLRVRQRALASAYLGGFRLRSRVVAGEVEELASGALDRADLMFSTPAAPWCQTSF
ncbi:MAG TPA: GNAT family N-acetyltransferase [Jatrophihabitans sp.]|nr:GNAT family N-acetyltransferase [Jatrophihabitans sp.]